MSQFESTWHAPNLKALVAEYSSEVFPIGSKMMLRDGRVYRFGKLGAVAALEGKVYQNVGPTTNHTALVTAAAVAGATSVTVTLAGTLVTKDQYAQGYLFVESSTGLGQVFKIKSHPAAASTATCVITLHNDTPVRTALASTSISDLFLRRADTGALVHPSPPTFELLGVPAYPLAANKYGWFQVGGFCSVLEEGTCLPGDWVVASLTADGAVAPSTGGNAETDTPIGICIYAAGNAKYGVTDLKIG